ncbi:ATP-dependent RNA helicase HrpA [Oryzihumus sp.]|uniref:ATP-dependent RNA helicase HrpA n=1 Tax=Oryzihumus sp. TaxID=1968903 RepID=UPI002EDA5717
MRWERRSTARRAPGPVVAAPRTAASRRRPAGSARRRWSAARQAAREARMARRRAAMPTVTYPEDLPVAARKDDIAALIRDHQVVIVAGETGSGKTTQLPKICLELGRGVEGLIGHTQPRRIAARSVAERIAEELGTELGTAVGYQVRFTDRSSDDTLVKVMTDGILLSEMQRDRDLRKYDTIIIDEAHERSLNIDFILGYLKQLLPRRPDLKVIVTSATIDPERFARHFERDGVPAPIIEVSGRTYPVEVRYRPLLQRTEEGDVDIDQVTGICQAVEELWTEGTGDILVFLSGEREIRDTADALTGMSLPHTEILPLYARLSAAEQHRVFGSHTGRRVVLATNVAETSLTVPGIRYVVDAGTARISRYSQRTKVQRLPIEPISQASARQRAGRCGRVADGICIRLYSEDDFENRPAFTDPEILRTNLASVILQMTSLGLGDIARFPFVDPPDSRQISDGVRLLEELEAIRPEVSDPRKRLTAYGRSIAQLPLDPRLARMVLEADRNGALREVLVIVAALSIQDPRERPADKQQQADEKHRRFADEHSDFIALTNLWGYLREQQKALSGSAFRRMCKAEYLHYLRVREWQDLHSQLKQACKSLGLHPNETPATPDQVHQSLLAGLLSHIGLRDVEKREYLGARGARFGISPGSSLFRKQPQWVMAAELVETTRLWARVNARIDPAWVEKQAQHLVKRQYSEPHWERRRASAVALEKVTLYGVPLVAGRKVGYGRVNPEESRELFIRHALVEGDWDTEHRFFHDNRALVERLGELEARARRRGLIVDDETLVAFYDKRIPADVVSGRHFDSWWKKTRREQPDLLTFTEDLLVTDEAGAVSADDYPQVWRQGSIELPVSYQFEPGTAADGVTVHVPVDVLNQVEPDGFDWQVPGLRHDLATALLKSLPKATRRSFVPAPDHAAAALADADPDAGPITEELARALKARTGTGIDPMDWDWTRVPDHLRITFRVEDRRRSVLGEGKDLEALKAHLAPQVRQTMARAASSVERKGLRQWDFGDLPATFERTSGERVIQGFPAVVDHGESVSVEVLPTAAERDAASRLGVRRLLLLNTTAPWKRVLATLTNAQKLTLGNNPHGSVPALLEDCLACAVDSLVAERPGGTVRTPAEFEETLALVRQNVVPRVLDVVAFVEPVLLRARAVEVALSGLTSPLVGALKADLTAQLGSLIHPGCVAETGYPRLRHVERYLRAMLVRIDKAPGELARDAERLAVVERVQAEYADLLASLPPTRRTADDVRDLRWMVEELRVSLFAQTLGTAYPVSEKRIYKAMDAVESA